MEQKTVIIGAGISGLIAAYELEQRGVSPLILETSDRVGGRLKTDNIDGAVLDHGFQVLLTAYPEVQKYLDYEALDLKFFDNGAMIFDGPKKYAIGDPLRNSKMILPMLASPVGSISDKWKMYGLRKEMAKHDTNSIFNGSPLTTIDYLRQKGFSERIIGNFFLPFFAGIFLEPDLETSSSMFRFIFKMFSEGNAAIPAEGIQAIPFQLKKKLLNTEIRCNTRVLSVDAEKLIVDSGESISYDKLIIATDPTPFFHGMEKQEFKSVTCMYFECDSSCIGNPLIGLLANGQNLVNNFYFLADLDTCFVPKCRQVLSATVLKSLENMENSEDLVKREIEAFTGLKMRHLKTYSIPRALPTIEDPQYAVAPTVTKIQDKIFVAGDQLLNPSLNAAMLSGRLAAVASMA